MKQNSTKELQRCAVEAQRLREHAQTLVEIADRVEDKARDRAQDARDQIRKSKTDQERAAHEGTYAQALQDQHCARVVGAAAHRLAQS